MNNDELEKAANKCALDLGGYRPGDNPGYNARTKAFKAGAKWRDERPFAPKTAMEAMAEVRGKEHAEKARSEFERLKADNSRMREALEGADRRLRRISELTLHDPISAGELRVNAASVFVLAKKGYSLTTEALTPEQDKPEQRKPRDLIIHFDEEGIHSATTYPKDWEFGAQPLLANRVILFREVIE